MTIGMVATLRNARLDAITTFAAGSGKLRFYSGTQPATGGTATTLLAELTMNATMAPASSAGVLTMNAVTGANASSTGTGTWWRLLKSDGTTIVMDGTLGVSASDLNITSTAFVSGQPVALSSWTLTDGNP